MKRMILKVTVASLSMVALVTSVFANVHSEKISNSINQLVIFSDSFSDNGNLYYLLEKDTNGLATIPQKPYYQGRFTNGLVWPEYFRDKNKVDMLNFSVAGARVTNSGGELPVDIPDLGEQINQYLDNLKSTGQTVNQKAMMAIALGPNDYALLADACDANSSLSQLRNEINSKTEEVIQSMKLSTQKLVENGAKHFVFFNLPPLDSTPRINPNSNVGDEHNSGCKYMVDIAAFITTNFNAALSGMILEMKASPAFADGEVNIVLLDMEKLLSEILLGITQLDPEMLTLFGVESQDADKIDTTNACYTGTWFGYKKNPLLRECSNPQQHLFYDNVHPATHIHEYVSDKLTQQMLQEGYSIDSILNGMRSTR
jgi:thermolabile hemolysin